ncbi:hypothetical protein F5984_12100 [Rudanella paleaurantiibacter]|uniref:Glycosyltransferase RgtA/B/C/D-like domain-containing protein n=1 Tax=Rudanella paleaurantiibacter TaxID=2614655 RepID=A0A7J5TZJ4_9BACT|nr:hypothetical protein [Rudanella paleaurantiibacter]KAB7730877.1 hypothetical protein F5984_12100 [Rudanella paleaurantiibacter]
MVTQPTRRHAAPGNTGLNGRNLATGLLLAVPIGIVLATVLTYALNLPYWDDYLVQEQLLLLKSQPSGRLKLLHLFDQHWEHRIVWTRLVFAGWYKLNGVLNYYGLTLVGVSGLLALMGVLILVFRKTGLSLLYLLPVPFWLFTLQSHENLLWAMASIQNFWVLVFALASFYLLARPVGWSRLLALALAVLATYTSGNGSLVLLAGLAVLIWQAITGRVRFVWVGGWLAVTALSIAGYFYHYSRITFFPSPFRYPFIDWAKAFFVFFGAFADPYPYSGAAAYGYENPLGLTIFLGIVLVGVGGYLTWTDLWETVQKRKGTPGKITPGGRINLPDFFLATLLFLLVTAAITVYSRVGFAGPGYLLQGRYKVYSALTLAVVYLYTLYRLGRAQKTLSAPVLGVIATLSIGQSLLSDYLCLEGIVNQHRRTTAEYFNYLLNTPLKQQLALSTLFIPTEETFFSGQTRQLAVQSWLNAPASAKLDRFSSQTFMYWIEKSNTVNPTLNRPTDGTYVYMTSGTHTYLFAARPLRPAPLALGGFDGYFRPEGIRAQVLQEHLKPGTYRIGLLTNRAGQLHLSMTPQTVTFTSL